MSERILFFGGTFDPVHHGHLIVARALAERAGYNRVTFVPCAAPPHKAPPEAPAADRLEMLRLATCGEALFDISRVELDRPGPSYTYDTLCELRKHSGPNAELHWLIGADMLTDLPTWHRVEDVLALARMVVAVRHPWNEKLACILEALREKLPAGRVQQLGESVLAAPPIDISSTDIRGRIGERLSIRYLTPDSVICYIEKRGLYRS